MERRRKKVNEINGERTARVEGEQSEILRRLRYVETVVETLKTEVHELQLAKKKYHGDD